MTRIGWILGAASVVTLSVVDLSGSNPGVAPRANAGPRVWWGKLKRSARRVGAWPSRLRACKHVKIRSQVLIHGKAYAGIPIRVTTSPVKAAAGLVRSEPSVSLQVRTDAKGRISGRIRHCGPRALVGAKPPLLQFSFRTAYHGDNNRLGPSQTSWDFTRTVHFTGRGAKDTFSDELVACFHLRPVAPKVRFRIPIAERDLVDRGRRTTHVMGGPFGVDHSPPPRGRRLRCVDYDGRGGLIGPPFCYGGHDGTDFMLKGGFSQMRRRSASVVAAAHGKVIEVVDDLFDRCEARLHSKDMKGFFNVDCFGKIPGFPDACGSRCANHVIVEHRDGTQTRYWHIKKGSASKLGIKAGMRVRCGQKIAEVGSSGYSSAPHLHFGVRKNRLSIDPFGGKLSPRSLWVQQKGPGGLPAARCEASPDTTAAHD